MHKNIKTLCSFLCGLCHYPARPFRDRHKSKTINQSASTNAYVNDVLAENKHKHKRTLLLMSWLSSLAYKKNR